MTILMQMLSGREIPLPGFTSNDIDLHGDVAESLARICRFGGHVPGNTYSVGQHSVVGADAIAEETGDVNAAGYFLLHDAHEFVTGDFTNPFQRWLQYLEMELYGSAHIVKTLIGAAKAQLDAAILRAAGLPPMGQTYRETVHRFDVRMLATERRQLLAPAPASWGAEIDDARPIRMRGKLRAWPVAQTVQEFRHRLDLYCPTARRV